VLQPGSYSYSKFLSLGFTNDTMSSVDVGAGISVTLYQDDIGSRQATFTQSVPDLRTINMDNTVSAIVIRATDDRCSTTGR